MIDRATVFRLAELRRHIVATEAACGQTLCAIHPARHGEAIEATPFLTTCANDLENLARLCRQAADDATGNLRRAS